jgi:3-methyladenine DNA glycosylase AlkD
LEPRSVHFVHERANRASLPATSTKWKELTKKLLPKNMLKKLRKNLKKEIDLEYKKGFVRFFKEPIKLYGVKIPIVRKIGNKYFKEVKNYNKKKIFLICEDLMQSNYNEEFTIASSWLFKIAPDLEKKDFNILKKYLEKYVSNWAMCDDYCTHVLGYFIYKFPDFLDKSKKWANSNNRWLKRASAIIHIHPTKISSPFKSVVENNPKKYLNNIFYISDKLMKDEDDLVQKGFGWMLKEASGLFEEDVYQYVMKRKNIMPRTSLRYAIEKMPKNKKKQAMKITSF